MEDSEATNKPDTDKSVNDQHHGGRRLNHCFPDRCVFSIHDPLDIHPAEPKYIYAE